MNYDRQTLIPQIGLEGQKKLKKSTVTVIGAGGLGSPVLTYLTCAGVGAIRIVECDTVSESNLNRQFMYGVKDIGRPKVQAAVEKLSSLNPEVNFIAVNERLGDKNALECVKGSDVVVDCVDNISARVAVARACIRLDIPLVEGGISGFYGFVIDIGRDYPCLSCLGYDKAREKSPVPALGATAGAIGSMQANECIKLLLSIGEPLYGRMLYYDGLSGTWEEVRVKKADGCPVHCAINS